MLSRIKFIFLLGFILAYACKTKLPKDISNSFENEYFHIQGVMCIDSLYSGIDCIVGGLDCNGIQLNYEISNAAYTGPQDLKELFKNNFKAYYYKKFFDELHMDQKVFKLFIDSVAINKVVPLDTMSKLMFECSNCNALATIIFKKKQFNFPFQTNEKYIIAANSYKIEYKEDNGYLAKSYSLHSFQALPIGKAFIPKYSTNQQHTTLSFYGVPNSNEEMIILEDILSKITIK
jgi:hypothetical protein